MWGTRTSVFDMNTTFPFKKPKHGTPPFSSLDSNNACMPRQMPKIGICFCWTCVLIHAANPLRLSVSMQSLIAPTPGKMSRSHCSKTALEWNETGGFAPVEPSYVYYDHSYYGVGLDPEDLMAYSRYGSYLVPGVVKKGNVVGTQFHPEKSGKVGLSILDAFGRGIL